MVVLNIHEPVNLILRADKAQTSLLSYRDYLECTDNKGTYKIALMQEFICVFAIKK